MADAPQGNGSLYPTNVHSVQRDEAGTANDLDCDQEIEDQTIEHFECLPRQPVAKKAAVSPEKVQITNSHRLPKLLRTGLLTVSACSCHPVHWRHSLLGSQRLSYRLLSQSASKQQSSGRSRTGKHRRCSSGGIAAVKQSLKS